MSIIDERSKDASGLTFAIVVARFNDFVTRRLLDGATSTLKQQGATENDVDIFWVPGAFEIPIVAQSIAATGRYSAILCLGAVIEGETDHYKLVAEQTAAGIAKISLDTKIPCIFEVLATQTIDLALARAGGQDGNKGEDAAEAAIEVAHVLAQVKKLK